MLPKLRNYEVYVEGECLSWRKGFRTWDPLPEAGIVSLLLPASPFSTPAPTHRITMSAILELWLPILLSAVGVFVASSILHMLIPIHKGDHGALPNEEDLMKAMRDNKVQPGSYMFPHCNDMKEMSTDPMMEKYQNGPVGFMTVLPSGTPTIGKNLFQWFIFSITVSIFAAYVASFTLGTEAHYLRVFRLTGTVAFIAYGWGEITQSIWKGQSWIVTGKFLFDGLVYALVTAGVFGSMWPNAA